MASRILIFSIAMGANYSFEVKNFEIWAPAFFKHNSFIATVWRQMTTFLHLCNNDTLSARNHHKDDARLDTVHIHNGTFLLDLDGSTF